MQKQACSVLTKGESQVSMEESRADSRQLQGGYKAANKELDALNTALVTAVEEYNGAVQPKEEAEEALRQALDQEQKAQKVLGAAEAQATELEDHIEEAREASRQVAHPHQASYAVLRVMINSTTVCSLTLCSITSILLLVT